MKLFELRQAYYSARKYKRRKDDSLEFEIQAEMHLVELLDSINSRSFYSPKHYSFVVKRPRPREVFAASFIMRILQHYLDIRLRPFMEEEMTDKAFNNRVGLGTEAAILNVYDDLYNISDGYTKDCWIIKWDLQGYFPNISQDKVYKVFEDLILRRYQGEDIDEIIYIAKVCIFSYPTLNVYRKSPYYEWDEIPNSKSLFKKPLGIGAAIGWLLWQNLMNYYLNPIDQWAVNDLHLAYSRYVDDSVVITKNKEMMLALLPEFRQRYKDLGITMHPDKFYCQHFSKGLEFLGKHIKYQRIYLNNKIVNRAFYKVKFPYSTTNYLSCMNSYLGMLKTSSNKTLAIKLLNKISNTYTKDYINFKIKDNGNKSNTKSY